MWVFLLTQPCLNHLVFLINNQNPILACQCVINFSQLIERSYCDLFNIIPICSKKECKQSFVDAFIFSCKNNTFCALWDSCFFECSFAV